MKHVIKYESPYEYGNFSSEDRKEGRFYDCNGTKLPSVTTILSATKKDKESLTRWIERVGEEEANRIRDEAAARGSHVHYILEKQIVHGDLWDYRPDSGEEKRAYKMACKIMDEGFPRISQVYGCEVSLYNPDKYAGRADVVGVFEGEPAIMDFKQTNKPKKKEWVEDYFLQLVAYAEAHNEVYGTDIKEGHVFMCSRKLDYQQFDITPTTYNHYKKEWWNRVEEYYIKHAV